MIVALLFILALAVVAFFAYVAFVPTVPHWVRQLFHILIGVVLVGLFAGAGWAIFEVIGKIA